MKIQQIKTHQAFSRARRAAQHYLADGERLEQLCHNALCRESWGRLKAPVQDSVNLLRAYGRGDYRQISWRSLLLLVTGLVYFITPTDAIPDVILGWGWIDDGVVLSWVAQACRQELSAFQAWHRSDGVSIMPEDEIRCFDEGLPS